MVGLEERPLFEGFLDKLCMLHVRPYTCTVIQLLHIIRLMADHVNLSILTESKKSHKKQNYLY